MYIREQIDSQAPMNAGMQDIRGDAKSVSSLLSNRKYAIDYYQREYRWQAEHIQDLISDLTEAFENSYDASHERSAVREYGAYFLGSIIVSHRDGTHFIVDGQQRLTSLTLLLIYLRHQIGEEEQRAQLARMIFSSQFGKKSYNLDVDECIPVMDALYRGEPFSDPGESESVSNILARYEDINREFSKDLVGPALPFFADWLIERVFFVQITTASDRDAYTVFETMNDRGLSLTPTDMLKGYLLANITDPDRRIVASRTWKRQVLALARLGEDEDAGAIKSWLRGQHANSIRERKKGAPPGDFDLIGTEFHRWIRDWQNVLGLKHSTDFFRFIEADFAFYTEVYARIRQAAESMTPGLESVFYNAQNNFTLQYPLILAAIDRADSEVTVGRKIRLVADFVDILIAERQWSWRTTSYATMRYPIFQTILDIRGLPIEQQREILMRRIDEDDVAFLSEHRFGMHMMNRPQVHRILARITDFVETMSGAPSKYELYVTSTGNQRFEVEHIWADHPEWHKDEFDHPSDFQLIRNRIGGLLLLPKSFNASFGDKKYETKRKHYVKQNLLAQSLHELAYENNPGFVGFVKRSGLPFRPCPDFKSTDIEARSDLYRQVAVQIWTTQRLVDA